MFSVEQRERAREHLIEMGRQDRRIVAAAAIGSSADGGDRWSDLDLTFGVAEDASVETVLEEWTGRVKTELEAVVLFDLPFRSSIYRVFLLPGVLQVDLSFTTASQFGAHGPRFSLLFGEAVEKPWTEPAPAAHLLGLAIHHLVRARVSIERGLLWQAEHWVHEARDDALALACRRLGLEESNGRGFDKLPPEVTAPLAAALPGSLATEQLRSALEATVRSLLREADHVAGVDPRVPPLLETLLRESRTSAGRR
jgi:hypothetical protein